MTYTISYEYTPSMARRLYRQLVWKTQGEFVVWSIVIAAAGVAAVYFGVYAPFWTFLLGVVASWWYGWWAGARGFVAAGARLSSPVLEVTVDEQGCTVRSVSAMTRFDWSTVGGVYRLPSAVVLSRHAMSAGAVLPRDHTSAEAIAFVEQCAESAGARLR